MIDFKNMMEQMSEDSHKYSYGASKEESMTYSIQGTMIKTINAVYSQNFEGCVKEADKKSTTHISCTKHYLINQPEVLMFSLSWGDQPLPSEIMRTLISIPEFFNTEDLYDSHNK